MSKKILKPLGKVAKFVGGGGLVGKALKGKKKAAAPVEQERDGTPIITQLGAGEDPKKRLGRRGSVGRVMGTLLGGDSGTLGG